MMFSPSPVSPSFLLYFCPPHRCDALSQMFFPARTLALILVTAAYLVNWTDAQALTKANLNKVIDVLP
jgi:hypothetical protein